MGRSSSRPSTKREYSKSMFNQEDVRSVSACSEPEPRDSSRREFLRQLALAGAGAAALAVSQAPAEAAPSGGLLPGRYLINHNFGQNYMGIESQTGSSFSGRFD